MSLLKNLSGKDPNNADESSKPSTSKGVRPELPTQLENINTDFPTVKQSEIGVVLPKYATVLNKYGDKTIGIEDLDQLQRDLEKLLSTCCIRNRLLQLEMDTTKKQNPPVIRRRAEETPTARVPKDNARTFKARPTIAVETEVPKTDVPRNIIAEKFWFQTDAYCKNITKQDVDFLDSLIRECTEEAVSKIPNIDDQYVKKWVEEFTHEELEESGGEVEEAEGNANGKIESFVGGNIIREVNEQLKACYLNTLKTLEIPSKRNMCVELMAQVQGIWEPNDLLKVSAPEDEISQEIEKCKQELKAISEHNVNQLNKLRNAVVQAERRQQVEEKLKKLDRQVEQMYSKLRKVKWAAEDGKKQMADIGEQQIKNLLEQQAYYAKLYYELGEQESLKPDDL